MTPTFKVAATALVSFVSGALIIGAVGTLGIKRFLQQQSVTSYYENAVHAQFEVRALANLRNGNTDKVIRDLDLLLNAHTMNLAEYEKVVVPLQREEFVYKTVAEVRRYREQYPVHFEYPLQQATFQKALDHGKAPEGQRSPQG